MQPPEIDTLLAEGKYAEAAGLLRRCGELERAQALYEKIWDFRRAADVARERGDKPSLLRLLLDAKDVPESARVGRELLSAAPGEQARAAEVYERRRMWAEAAALREALGQLTEAHGLYRKAQQPLEAARLDETLGRAREAGILYEKLLAEEPGSPDAPRAHLSLGRILGGFNRHEEAVRHLQKAAATGADELVARARRLLVTQLAALGYRDAASSVLDALRTGDPRIPPLDAFLAAERRAAAHIAETRLGGRYVVERLLGSGGMGRVYLARDAFSGKQVAVKVVAPPSDARLAEGYRRFVREAQVVSSLSHANVVAVVAFHEELGVLAMEYMSGGTLADRLPGPLTPGAVRSLLSEVVSGLEAAHAHGVIHRDIKPANIFYAGSGEAKLGDFGVAHLQDLGATQTAGFIGTLAYMSPEQISGAPLRFATDVYALGVTAFQALTGRLPFRGPDFVAQHLGETPPRPSSLRPELHRGWDAWVLRALEKDPQARFSSLEELRRALLEIPIEPRLAGAAGEAVAEEPAPVREARTRYAVGGVLAETAISTIAHATDTTLGREVVLERFPPGYLDGEPGREHLRWLKALGRHGGPNLQRVLRIEPLAEGGHQVVFEAIIGPTPRPPELSPPALERLRRALAPLHADGLAHGSLADSIVLEEHGPTLLVAGRRPTAKSPDDERKELQGLRT
ncbi:MAG TPA: protein kinase [Kofleriaceae bacterium]|nr:protein kinase [Kofleriaceae bacterium]